MPLAAKVLIDGPSELIFDYSIPEGMGAQAGCRVHIPLRNRKAVGTILSLAEVEPDGFSLKPITSLIDPEPLLTEGLMKLARWMTGYYGTPLEQIMRSLLPSSVRQESHSAKTRKIVTLLERPDQETLEKLERRAPRQHVIISLVMEAGSLALKDLGGGSVLPSVRTLAKSGFLKITDEEVHRDPDAQETFLETKPFPLNSGQQAAYNTICRAIDHTSPEERKPILLHGITGSGKTEVSSKQSNTRSIKESPSSSSSLKFLSPPKPSNTLKPGLPPSPTPSPSSTRTSHRVSASTNGTVSALAKPASWSGLVPPSLPPSPTSASSSSMKSTKTPTNKKARLATKDATSPSSAPTSKSAQSFSAPPPHPSSPTKTPKAENTNSSASTNAPTGPPSLSSVSSTCASKPGNKNL